MGAHPYWYVVKYQPDIDKALAELREQEFRAGRYSPVMAFPDFPIGPNSPAPGAQHASIDEAREDAEEDGTRSILDLDHVADSPEYFAVAPLDDERLLAYFGTTKPTRKMVENCADLFEDIDRGQGVYVTLYHDGQPDEIFFAGYSFD